MISCKRIVELWGWRRQKTDERNGAKKTPNQSVPLEKGKFWRWESDVWWDMSSGTEPELASRDAFYAILCWVPSWDRCFALTRYSTQWLQITAKNDVNYIKIGAMASFYCNEATALRKVGQIKEDRQSYARGEELARIFLNCKTNLTKQNTERNAK